MKTILSHKKIYFILTKLSNTIILQLKLNLKEKVVTLEFENNFRNIITEFI